MVERFIILAIFVGLSVFAWMLIQRRQQAHLTRLATASLPEPLDGQVMAGRPSILYFTSEACHQCRLQQTPDLIRLSDLTGIAVYKLDAVHEPELADHFGVMTLPTTVVLDRNRKPAVINSGLAPLATLRSQTAELTP